MRFQGADEQTRSGLVRAAQAPASKASRSRDLCELDRRGGGRGVLLGTLAEPCGVSLLGLHGERRSTSAWALSPVRTCPSLHAQRRVPFAFSPRARAGRLRKALGTMTASSSAVDGRAPDGFLPIGTFAGEKPGLTRGQALDTGGLRHGHNRGRARDRDQARVGRLSRHRVDLSPGHR